MNIIQKAENWPQKSGAVFGFRIGALSRYPPKKKIIELSLNFLPLRDSETGADSGPKKGTPANQARTAQLAVSLVCVLCVLCVLCGGL